MAASLKASLGPHLCRLVEEVEERSAGDGNEPGGLLKALISVREMISSPSYNVDPVQIPYSSLLMLDLSLLRVYLETLEAIRSRELVADSKATSDSCASSALTQTHRKVSAAADAFLDAFYAFAAACDALVGVRYATAATVASLRSDLVASVVGFDALVNSLRRVPLAPSSVATPGGATTPAATPVSSGAIAAEPTCAAWAPTLSRTAVSRPSARQLFVSAGRAQLDPMCRLAESLTRTRCSGASDVASRKRKFEDHNTSRSEARSDFRVCATCTAAAVAATAALYQASQCSPDHEVDQKGRSVTACLPCASQAVAALIQHLQEDQDGTIGTEPNVALSKTLTRCCLCRQEHLPALVAGPPAACSCSRDTTTNRDTHRCIASSLCPACIAQCLVRCVAPRDLFLASTAAVQTPCCCICRSPGAELPLPRPLGRYLRLPPKRSTNRCVVATINILRRSTKDADA